MLLLANCCVVQHNLCCVSPFVLSIATNRPSAPVPVLPITTSAAYSHTAVHGLSIIICLAYHHLCSLPPLAWPAITHTANHHRQSTNLLSNAVGLPGCQSLRVAHATLNTVLNNSLHVHAPLQSLHQPTGCTTGPDLCLASWKHLDNIVKIAKRLA